LNDSVAYEHKDVFIISPIDYISGVQPSPVSHTQELIHGYKNTDVKVSGIIQEFDLLIGPVITDYQMSRTTWATCSTMICIVICVIMVLLRNIWLISFNGATQTLHAVVKSWFIQALINICSHVSISLLHMTAYISYRNSHLTSSILIAGVTSSLLFTDKFVIHTKTYNSFKKVLIWLLPIILISLFAFFGKQIYVEEYMSIPIDHEFVPSIMLPEEEFAYDEICSFSWCFIY
ncbi:4802_t:CDS:2, partial [Scutellospora calospora]